MPTNSHPAQLSEEAMATAAATIGDSTVNNAACCPGPFGDVAPLPAGGE
jgi:hypothetical protein